MEATRIAFLLPDQPYENLEAILGAAKKHYGEHSQEYRHGLEAALLYYVEPHSHGRSAEHPDQTSSETDG